MLGMDRAIVARRGKPPWFMPIGRSVASARIASAPVDNGPANRITSATRLQVAAKRGRTLHPAYSEAISLRQFMLAVARLRLNEGNALLGTESMETTRKGASHFSKMLIVES